MAMTTRKTTSEKPAETVVVYMTGDSYNLKRDDRVEVDKATAERLIRDRHAVSAEDAEAQLEREIRSGE